MDKHKTKYFLHCKVLRNDNIESDRKTLGTWKEVGGWVEG